ncbi:O-methyltransferase [Lophiotrema nucula]|uniref:O-methyltransferase n=1 Tax=Lophiotrema nucula TaxID=690887 RepID=A0A6A5YI01_9PLEO|nr:O-methyltransferase [Lophiotrema nucula]
MFKYLELDENEPVRTRYGRAVAQHTINETDEIKDIVPWDKFKLVVDIGAGNGQVGAHLTKHHKNLHIINQDMENVIADRIKELSLAPAEEQASFREVDFEPQDYYAPQTRTDADAYLIRFVLHNNNDENCVKILKAVVPALAANKNGEHARLLVAERVMPEWDTDKSAQLKQQRIEDMAMLISCSGKQRSVAELEALLKKADPALEIDQIYCGKDVFQVLSVRYAQAP